MLIYPAIDLLGGKCVRLTQGDYQESKTYSDNPLEVALAFEAEGAEWLHIVDLDAAKSGELTNLDVVRRIAQGTRLKVQVGGGIRSLEAAHRVLDSGVARVIFGSSIAKDLGFAQEVFKELGQRAVAGIDGRNGQVAVHGWQESSPWTVLGLAQELGQYGCQTIVATEISRDGMLDGPDLALYKDLVSKTDSDIIASGGVSSLKDLEDLESIGVPGAIVGKALYEGRFKLSEALR